MHRTAFALALLAAAPAFAAGALDPHFGADGLVMRDAAGGQEDGLNAGLIDAQGRHVGAGFRREPSGAILVRWLPDGTPDAGFGDAGVVQVVPDVSSVTAFVDVVEYPDGRLLAAGLTNGAQGVQSLLCRFLASGVPDASFGKDGCLRPALAPDTEFDAARALVLQPDGRPVFAGEVRFANDDVEWFVARLLDDGSFDRCFGDVGCAGGGVRFGLGSIPRFDVGGLALGPDGRIVVVGDVLDQPGETDLVAVRVLPTGAIDNAFSGDGTVLIDLDDLYDDRAHDVVVLPDNRIRVVGSSGNAFGRLPGVVGLTAQGTLDGPFGTGLGRTVLPFDDVSPSQVATRAVLLADGSLVLAGHASDASANCAVARLDAAGEPDPRFGIGGVTVVDSTLGQPPLRVDLCYGLDVQGDAIGVFGLTGTTQQSRDSLAFRLDLSGVFRNGFED